MKWFNIGDRMQIKIYNDYKWGIGIVVEKQYGDAYEQREVIFKVILKPNIAILVGRALVNIGLHVGKTKYKHDRGEDSGDTLQ